MRPNNGSKPGENSTSLTKLTSYLLSSNLFGDFQVRFGDTRTEPYANHLPDQLSCVLVVFLWRSCWLLPIQTISTPGRSERSTIFIFSSWKRSRILILVMLSWVVMPGFLATLSCESRSGTSMDLGKVGKERGAAKATKATKAMKMQVETQEAWDAILCRKPCWAYCRGCFGRCLVLCMLQTVISYSAVKINLVISGYFFSPFIQSLQVSQVSQVSPSVQLDPVDRHSHEHFLSKCGLTLPLHLSELLVWGS